MRNCMFKIAKLAAFSRKNISMNARSLDTGQNCTLWTKIGHCGQKFDTMDKNWTLWTNIWTILWTKLAT